TTDEPPARIARAFEQVGPRVSGRICIFEDGKFANFFPLSLAQPVFDLRVGAGTLRERWLAGGTHGQVSLICRDYLADVVRLAAPGLPVNDAVAGDTLLVNGRWLCMAGERDAFLSRLPDDSVALQGGCLVAARVSRDAAADLARALRAQITDAAVDAVCSQLEKARAQSAADADAEALSPDLMRVIDARRLRRVEMPEARVLSFPWQLVEHNSACIADDFARAARGHAKDAAIHPGVHLVEPKRIAIGSRAAIRAGTVIDASDGPVVIGEGVVVMANATIVGPAAIGAGSVVKAGARILAGTSVGKVCKVGGEVDESIFADYTNKQHDGFLGHTYLGSWVNIGAASNNSDLKNNYGSVRMWNAGRPRDTGRQFLGLVMGDHTKTGINAVFNTGTVVGFNCNLYSSEMPDAFVPSFSWGHGRDVVPYELEKAVQTATAAMHRRGIAFTAEHRRLFERVHDMVARAGRNA
ncbi:MAG TPA: putative sugar nucleotidyl transferase, partial [Candidatus Krumholzibacteria bacterium]|nr:putative sugar nucleotidyl transferase [Candidatus Krumholzibacteria bacterium]